MKKVQHIRTIFPIGFKELIKVMTTSLTPTDYLFINTRIKYTRSSINNP